MSNSDDVSSMSPEEMAMLIMSKKATSKQYYNILNRLHRPSIEVLSSRPNIVPIELGSENLLIIGDLHGCPEGLDLVRLLFQVDTLKKKLFLGDFVDRGKVSLEIMLMLMLLLLKNPEMCYLLRGNHEDMQICGAYGFITECELKLQEFSSDSINLFEQFFCALSLGAVIIGNDGIRSFAAHGGPPVWLECGITKTCSIAELNEFNRHTVFNICDSHNDAVIGLTWNDPSSFETETRLRSSTRGIGFICDAQSLKMFLDENELDHFYRAHQVVKNGHETCLNGKLTTIFTVPNYCGETNHAAIACLSPDNELRWFIFSKALGNQASSAPTIFTDEAFKSFLEISDPATNSDEAMTIYEGTSRQSSLSSTLSFEENSFSPDSSPRGYSFSPDSLPQENVEDVVEDIVKDVVDNIVEGGIITPPSVFQLCTL